MSAETEPIPPNPGWMKMLLAALVAADIGFIVIHLIYSADHKKWWDLGEDRSVAEIFQYLKLGGASIGLLMMYLRTKQLVLLGWSGTYAFLTIDDSFEGHEKVGGRLMRFFDIPNWEDSPFGTIRGQDFGEIGAALIFLTPILFALAYGYVRANRPAQAFSWRMFWLSAYLGTAGVVVDFVVNAMDAEWIFLIEDGNEMFAASLIATLVAIVVSTNDLRSPSR